MAELRGGYSWIYGKADLTLEQKTIKLSQNGGWWVKILDIKIAYFT